MFAGAAGVVRLTAAMSAAWQPDEKYIAKLKDGIVGPKRAKRPTAKQKTVGGTGKIKIIEKTWMMPLQHPGVHGIRGS